MNYRNYGYYKDLVFQANVWLTLNDNSSSRFLTFSFREY